MIYFILSVTYAVVFCLPSFISKFIHRFHVFNINSHWGGGVLTTWYSLFCPIYMHIHAMACAACIPYNVCSSRYVLYIYVRTCTYITMHANLHARKTIFIPPLIQVYQQWRKNFQILSQVINETDYHFKSVIIYVRVCLYVSIEEVGTGEVNISKSWTIQKEN